MNLLTLSEVARRLGVSEKTARQIRSELPGAVRIGQRVKYREDSLAEFIGRGGCRPDTGAVRGMTAHRPATPTFSQQPKVG